MSNRKQSRKVLNSADLDMHLENDDFNGRGQFSPRKQSGSKKTSGYLNSPGLKKKSPNLLAQ